MTDVLSSGVTRACLWGLTAMVACLLNGCATVVAIVETTLTPPSISDTVDSFESAALAIRTSNRILLQVPISEEEVWPDKLFRAPSAGNALLMGIAGFASANAVTVPTEFDPETGFPRPTSPLYILIKDRNEMLDREVRESYLAYFRNNPEAMTCDLERRLPGLNNPFVYRNTLMAYGTVAGNAREIVSLEQKIGLMADGYRECDAWVRRSAAGEVIPVACRDPGLRNDEVEWAAQLRVQREELEEFKRLYGKLSRRVYQASVAGADFTAAALTKLTGAIIRFSDALKNADKELEGWKGAVNAAMIIPRLKNFYSAIGVYAQNLGLQCTAYATMYRQINSLYGVEENAGEREAKQRVERVEAALGELAHKLERVSAGEEVEFTATERERWAGLAAAFPAVSPLAGGVVVASRRTP